MSGGVLLQAVISGLSVGAVYGLVALGFTLVFSLTRVLALAHGDIVVGSVLVAVLAVVGRTPVASSPGVGNSLALIVLALAAGVALAVLSYIVAVRPFLDRSHRSEDVLGWVAGTVTAGLVVRTALGLALPAAAYAVPDPLHLDDITSSGIVHLPGGTTVTVRSFAVFGVAITVAVVTDWFIRASRLGRGMRAVADDVDAATVCGVDVERVVVAAFAVAGLLAAVASLLDSPGRAVAVDSGALLGLSGAAAALLGRLGSPRGALFGGLVLGVMQQLVASSTHLGASWATTLPLVVLVAVIAVRPGGLGAGRMVAVE
jgi:branched-subunit amino acid ABC-type transport system permease component